MATQLRYRKRVQVELLGVGVADFKERKRLHRKALYLFQLPHCDISAKPFAIADNGFCPARTYAGNFLQHRGVGTGEVDVLAQLYFNGVANGVPVVFLVRFVRIVLLLSLVGFVQFALLCCPFALVTSYGFHRESGLIVVANGDVGF